ncbi:class C sortase [Xylanimonas allomyrinae]|uniref:class C sortase n=1 Tax=Xylanimonas allomyrinae TaxID=2509459 RepID=UPI001B85C29C|nr:class C sortase [Xylanimonas allomyrinae]
MIRSSGPFARLRIPSIDVDLPVYHGTSDATLLKGAGHLQGTSLPVGGPGTRAVLTAHRGLASATMFTHLNRVDEGDAFVIEVLGRVLAYRVIDIAVIEPHSTEEIRPVPREDLVTLVTCTPLGINTQRILVTGERVVPTPADDLAALGSSPDVPRFPWWAVAYAVATLGNVAWYQRSRRPTGARLRRRAARRRRAAAASAAVSTSTAALAAARGAVP